MLKTADIFQNGMVLQEGCPVRVFGTSDPDVNIHVTIQNHEAKTESDGSGKWMAVLPALCVSYAETLTITDGTDSIVFDDVQIGEVFLAGGQSNMEYLMGFDAEYERELKYLQESSDIRFYDVPEISYEGEEKDFDYSEYGKWRKCTKKDLEYFSAVPYYFLQVLHRNLNCPCAVVGCNWGGTRISCWMDEETVRDNGGSVWLDEFEEKLLKINREKEAEDYKGNPAVDPADPLHNDFAKVMYPGLSWKTQCDIMEAEGTLPETIIGDCHPWRPCGLYETMLKTIMPYTFKGVLFYQGESDEIHPEAYEGLLTALINLWRRDFLNEQLPFFVVQLAPFEAWFHGTGVRYPLIREAQYNVSKKLKNVYLASNGDAGMRYDIHPKYKRPVSERIGRLVLEYVYGRNVKADAPEMESVKKVSDRLYAIFFRYGEGLHIKGETLNAMRILDSSGKELPYSIEIKDNHLYVHLEDPACIQIQFAKTGYYEINLYNDEGIPALPFMWKEKE